MGGRGTSLAFRVGQCARPLWILYNGLCRDFVEHQQSTSLASLLQRWPAQRLQHMLLTLKAGVPKPVEDEAFRSPLRDCFDLGNVFLRVWVPDRRSILQQRADEADFIVP